MGDAIDATVAEKHCALDPNCTKFFEGPRPPVGNDAIVKDHPCPALADWYYWNCYDYCYNEGVDAICWTCYETDDFAICEETSKKAIEFNPGGPCSPDKEFQFKYTQYDPVMPYSNCNGVISGVHDCHLVEFDDMECTYRWCIPRNDGTNKDWCWDCTENNHFVWCAWIDDTPPGGGAVGSREVVAGTYRGGGGSAGNVLGNEYGIPIFSIPWEWANVVQRFLCDVCRQAAENSRDYAQSECDFALAQTGNYKIYEECIRPIEKAYLGALQDCEDTICAKSGKV